MYKQIIISAGGGLVSAILALGLLTGSSGALLFAYFALLPLLLIGLSLGLVKVTIAIVVAAIAVAGLAGLGQAAVYVASISMPAWLITRYGVTSRSGPGGVSAPFSPGDILVRVAIGGGLLLMLAALATGNSDESFEIWVGTFIERMLSARLAAASVEAERVLFAQSLTPLFPAITALSWLIMVVINAALAQMLLTRGGKNLRSRVAYTQTAISEWYYWVFIAAAALSLLASGSVEYLTRNLAVILAAPFLFVGLGVIHCLARRVTAPGMALTAFYVVLILFSWAGIIVAGLGFLEPWTRLNRRFTKLPPGIDMEDE
ncbi:MAG: DUF2232 domain-containing protein [Pseudomonadota bacterium]|nr:DUF2232 domain-containing protein [Pseudomonadota bacterium]